MDRIRETLNILEAAKEKSDAVLVAYSGGKDSLCTLDLCSRVFSRVEAFHMYFLPGLDVIEQQLDYARQRWGVKIYQYPHWTTRRYLTQGVYCFNSYKHDDLPEWKLQDVYDLACAESGIPIIATGAKRVDSLWRRRMLKTWGDTAQMLYPCIGWSLFDVQAYLRARKIELPKSAGGSKSSGVGLVTREVLHLHDHWPQDYERIKAVFPLVEAVVKRRDWYGVTE